MIEALTTAFDGLLRQLLVGLGPLAAVAALLYLVIHATQTLLVRAVGWKGVVVWTGWLGTPVHEASHYLVGKLCGIQITEVKLFDPDEASGVLGYVNYVKPKLEPRELHKVIGTFLMGIAPLFGGAAVLVGAWLLLIAPEDGGAYARDLHAFVTHAQGGGAGEILRGSWALIGRTYAEVFARGLGNPRAWVFLYVALAVGAHLAPSSADLRGGLVGFLVLCGLAAVANLVAALLGADPRAFAGRLCAWTAPATALLVMTLSLNLGNLALAFLLAQGKALLARR